MEMDQNEVQIAVVASLRADQGVEAPSSGQPVGELLDIERATHSQQFGQFKVEAIVSIESGE
jgi:hypothetical protein